MRIHRLNKVALAIALGIASAAVASAQIVANGNFTPPANSSANTTTYSGNNGGVNLPPANASVNWYVGSGPGETASFGMDPANFVWTFTATSSSDWINAGVAENGSAYGFAAPPNGVGQIAFLQSSTYLGGSGGAISQMVDLTGGASNEYSISFYLDNRQANGATQVPVTVTIGGVVFNPVMGAQDGDWTAYSGTFTGSGDETLEFSVPGSGYTDSTAGLAEVSISVVNADHPAPLLSNLTVPEGSASWLYLLLAGAATFGAIFLSRREGLASRTEA